MKHGFVIQEYLYKCPVSVFHDLEEYAKWKKDHRALPVEPDTLAETDLVVYERETYLIMYLPVDCKPGTVAHEALHATTYILRTRGIKHNFDDDETAAYLLEYLVERIYEGLECNQRKSAANKARKRSSKKQSSRT